MKRIIEHHIGNLLAWAFVLTFLGWMPIVKCFGQDIPKKVVPSGTEGEVTPVPDSTREKKGHKPKWNFVDFGFTTFDFGGAILYEYAGYTPDATVKKQMDSAKSELNDGFGVRDFRFYFNGKLKTKRTIIWKAGIMYDGVSDSWLIRETGLLIGIPELSGHLFIGRTKEGFSLSKVMNGYAGEMHERHMALDVIPILGDGVKLLGFLEKQHVFWNIGMFTDWINKDQGFSTYSWQFVSRVGWLPIYHPSAQKYLHLGCNFRYAQPDDNKMRIKSRPESNLAPYFLDTKDFSTTRSTHMGGEAYFTSGSLMLGSEYAWHKFHSPEGGNPTFSGGEFVVSYILTGESRPYSNTSAIYSFVPVKKPIFKGGLGAFELVGRISTFDLTSGYIKGGKFWKVTPMVNWYLHPYLRLEFLYGYGVLDRFDMQGGTHFFQTRIQFTIL